MPSKYLGKEWNMCASSRFDGLVHFLMQQLQYFVETIPKFLGIISFYQTYLCILIAF
jgi:hypothetical protein